MAYIFKIVIGLKISFTLHFQKRYIINSHYLLKKDNYYQKRYFSKYPKKGIKVNSNYICFFWRTENMGFYFAIIILLYTM